MLLHSKVETGARGHHPRGAPHSPRGSPHGPRHRPSHGGHLGLHEPRLGVTGTGGDHKLGVICKTKTIVIDDVTHTITSSLTSQRTVNNGFVFGLLLLLFPHVLRGLQFVHLWRNKHAAMTSLPRHNNQPLNHDVPVWRIRAWPVWGRAWRSRLFRVSMLVPTQHRVGADRSRCTNRPRSIRTCDDPRTTPTTPPPTPCHVTRQRTSSRPASSNNARVWRHIHHCWSKYAPGPWRDLNPQPLTLYNRSFLQSSTDCFQRLFPLYK